MKRRHPLKSSTCFAIAAATDTRTARLLPEAQRRPSASNTRYLSPQGVASGNPRDMSIVFWTRCVATLFALVLTGLCGTSANAGIRNTSINISLVIEAGCTANTEGNIPSVSCGRADSWYLIRSVRPDPETQYSPDNAVWESRPGRANVYFEVVF